MSCPVNRIYPLRQPKNYRPPIPRWQLKLPAGVDSVYTLYVGVQRKSSGSSAQTTTNAANIAIQSWLEELPPAAYESFVVLDGHDEAGSDVLVCYYSDLDSYAKSWQSLRLPQIYESLGENKSSVGLWCERFATSASRLETNYSGLDYLPGLARLPRAEPAEHTYSAYWGAARDRIPDSSHDLFLPAAETETAPPNPFPQGRGEYLSGSNYENIVHIRSGQFWENCGSEERAAYETKLEPALRTGLSYLWENSSATGTIGLRFLRNKSSRTEQILGETCAAGFFRSLADLESWAEKHPSHKAIFLGAIKHAKTFGERRRLRTWHEVSVLKAGDVHFEYLNCTQSTGAIAFVKLDTQQI
ncbi:heme-containing dehydratase protein [Bisporella sp. PMI_857]|nr:heme-containing dehydratase protein [Bisporella sp. PMI_857]